MFLLTVGRDGDSIGHTAACEQGDSADGDGRDKRLRVGERIAVSQPETPNQAGRSDGYRV